MKSVIRKTLAGMSAVLVLGAAGYSETVTEIKQWTIEGSVEMDSSKSGPDGNPSIKLGPKSKAVLKLRPEDGSGKLTLFVYDDGTVASPDKQKSVGPRWGFTQADGRLIVGGIMYARFFAAEGSLSVIETQLTKPDWNGMKFAGVRGAAGWKKWEFEYNPDTGLKITVDGKAVSAKYFDWNQSQATGFNGIVLFGDATAGGTPQTVWVSGIDYTLGGPMNVKPSGSASAPAPGAAVNSSAPAPVAVPFVMGPPLDSTWTAEGAVCMDTNKPGPDGKPSIKVGPKSSAVLKLRPADGSGKMTLYVYDDGAVASPNKQKAVGPRWGFIQANGRVCVGGIMYAKFFQPEGSLAVVETKLNKGDWNGMKFAGARGAAGWKKWEFEYDPNSGLKISVEGKAVPQKYFNWDETQATGFNGIVLLGDATAAGTPQTVWVGGISYELGPPMKVRPTSMAALLGPDAKPVPFPGPTLAADLIGLKVPVSAQYASAHPRLLFTAADKAALLRKAKDNPKLWSAVLDNAKAVKSEPDAALIKSGAKYWRVEALESGALAWFLTGDKELRDGTIRMLLAYCKEPLWGTLFRPNLDLAASWSLYHVSIAYDILYSELNEADRKTIQQGLAAHAKAIYDDHDPEDTEKIRYDQNHTYIPTVGMLAASLALLGDVPEAQDYLNRGYAILRRSRYALGNDGYYYEGFGYWTYALHWHVRGAEMLARATGEKMFDAPFLKDNWLYALHMKLPGNPGAFNIHDSGFWDSAAGQPRPAVQFSNLTMLWAIASATGSAESQLAGNLYNELKPETDYPASAFLWFNPAVKPVKKEKLKPYHHFKDHDVVAWRSGWQPDATCYLFRCGPPEGHQAAGKLGQMQDWLMNAGHVHPNIGAFWMYSKGTYLVVETGYTANKWTKDHNTLLVDGKGQSADGTYHNERNIPYEDLNQAHIDQSYLCDAYGYASGSFGGAYTKQVPGVNLHRSVLMTPRWLLVIDDMDSATDHSLTWLCHADAAFQLEGSAYVARLPQAALAVFPLAPAGLQSKSEPTIVYTGKGVADMVPDKGKPIQHGYHLSVTQPQPSKTVQFVNLLASLDKDEKPPEVQLVAQEKNRIVLQVKWPNGKAEKVQLDLAWKSGGDSGPAVISAE
jgi:hypothetical protein